VKFDTKAIAYVAREAAKDRDFYVRSYDGVTILRSETAGEVYVVVEQRPRREIASIAPHDLAWLDAKLAASAVMDKIDQAAARLRGKALLDYLAGPEAVEFGELDEETIAKMERASLRLMQVVDGARKA
jgi:hypothetical protein